MRNHSLMIAAMSAIGLTVWAPASSGVISAQEKSERHVSVYVAALQGARMPERQDALDLTMTERLNKIQGRKAMVVFTDGVDTSSRFARWQDVKERIEESGVIVYPIRYDTQADVTSLFTASSLPPNVRNAGSGRIVKEYEQAAQSLKQFASVSGGRYYEVVNMGGAKQAFTNIAEELRLYYWLGYYPADTTRDASYRKIRVAIDRPNVAIRARDGYGAPSGGGKQ